MKKLLALALALALLAGFAACGVKPKTAADWLDLGEKYLLDLDYDQAVAALDHAIEIEPKNPRLHVMKIIVYVMNPNWVGPPPVVPDDVPSMPAIPPLPADGRPEPEEIVRPIIDWLKEQGWVDFVEKLLELLKNRWPEVVWGTDVPVAATVAETTTMNVTTTEATIVTNATATTAEKPTTSMAARATTINNSDDYPELRQAIDAFNSAKTAEEKFKYMFFDYAKVMNEIENISAGLTLEQKESVKAGAFAAMLKPKSQTQPITRVPDEYAAEMLRDLKSSGDLSKYMLDVGRATDVFYVGDLNNPSPFTYMWIKLDGRYMTFGNPLP